MPVDKYASLTALKEHVGKDSYRIRVLDRDSIVTVISPHGGYIDPGTSAVARAIAGRQYNHFDFQGLQRENPLDLHVTSTKFRDPQLSRLLQKSLFAVSVHCMGPQENETIFLGGLNRTLKQLVLSQLLARDFSVEPNSPRYRGENQRNIVNLPCQRGVQLELPTELVMSLFRGQPFARSGRCPKTTPRFEQLVQAVRIAIAQYKPIATINPCETAADSEEASEFSEPKPR